MILSTGTRSVRFAASRLGLSFSVLEAGLLAYAAEESAFLASVMGETTAEKVVAAIQKGLEEGETVRGLIKRLRELPTFDNARAKMVARTETTRAWNGAQRRSLSDYQRSSGRVVMKTWLSSRDDRVREEHAELDGEQQPIDSAFTNGLMEPGEPNCRCTLTYSLSDPISSEENDE